jgi:hypothetical protein
MAHEYKKVTHDTTVLDAALIFFKGFVDDNRTALESDSFVRDVMPYIENNEVMEAHKLAMEFYMRTKEFRQRGEVNEALKPASYKEIKKILVEAECRLATVIQRLDKM